MAQGNFIPSRPFFLTLPPEEEEIKQGDHGNVAGILQPGISSGNANLQAPASLLATYRLRTGHLTEGIVLNYLNTWR